MTDINLDELSLKELKQLQKQVTKAVETFEDRHKAEARAKLEAVAREMGYSFADLGGVESKSNRGPVAAKYRHPTDASVTWSGRGRKPLWFVDALKNGKTPDDLAL
jgi:DNA-binding protein H-NS